MKRSKRGHASGINSISFVGSDLPAMRTPRQMGNVPLTSDLPPSILREIGKICVAYSRIEWLLNKTIYDVLKVSSAEGRLAVRDPAPDQRVELIEDLMKLNNIKCTVERVGELKTFLNEAKT